MAGTGTSARTQWWALVWIALTQLMMVVDGTVMNIAVPSAQRDLDLSDGQRQWVIAAYVLAFGSLLLLGGRIGDVIGRRRALMIGLLGFTAASTAGGLAVSAEMLVAARAAQGVFGALVTPAALALLSTTFPDGADRVRAYGVFGTVMGSGSGVGLLLGGALTDSWGWRWALLINVPVAVVAGLGLLRTLRAETPTGGRIDLVGAGLSAAGLTALTLGLAGVESATSTPAPTLALLAGGLALLAAFALRQHRSRQPLLPLALFTDRRRSAAFAAMLAWGVAILPAFLFLSVHLQQIAGFGPLLAGAAFMPYTAAILLTVRLVRPVVRRAGPRTFLVVGLSLLAAGLLALTRLQPDSPYWSHVLPVVLLLGLGTGCVQPAANDAATRGAGPASGVAGAVAGTAQQVGASLGLALLGAVAVRITTGLSEGSATPSPASILAGYHGAALTGAALLLTAALGVLALAGGRGRRHEPTA